MDPETHTPDCTSCIHPTDSSPRLPADSVPWPYQFHKNTNRHCPLSWLSKVASHHRPKPWTAGGVQADAYLVEQSYSLPASLSVETLVNHFMRYPLAPKTQGFSIMVVGTGQHNKSPPLNSYELNNKTMEGRGGTRARRKRRTVWKPLRSSGPCVSYPMHKQDPQHDGGHLNTQYTGKKSCSHQNQSDLQPPARTMLNVPRS